jgi:hypothetical protein
MESRRVLSASKAAIEQTVSQKEKTSGSIAMTGDARRALSTWQEGCGATYLTYDRLWVRRRKEEGYGDGIGRDVCERVRSQDGCLRSGGGTGCHGPLVMDCYPSKANVSGMDALSLGGFCVGAVAAVLSSPTASADGLNDARG